MPPLAVAGLWESWNDSAGEPVRSFTIITTTVSNAGTDPRLDAGGVRGGGLGTWLTEGPVALLRPAADDVLTRWKISSRVNSVRNNDPDLLEEVDRAGA